MFDLVLQEVGDGVYTLLEPLYLLVHFQGFHGVTIMDPGGH